MNRRQRCQEIAAGLRPLLALVALLCIATPLWADAEVTFPTWLGEEHWITAALREGELVEKEPVGRGITKPFRVTLLHDGRRVTAIWKPLSSVSERDPRESWAAEVAAYRLSRHLGFHRVPPTVARTVRGVSGSMQLWVDGATPFMDLEGRPGTEYWSREISQMRTFDVLIDNYDRNQGNFMVAERGRLVWIDHSRALSFDPRGRRDKLELPMPRSFDRQTLDRLRALDLESLDDLIGDLVPRMTQRAILRQRDRLLERWEEGLQKWGSGVYLD